MKNILSQNAFWIINKDISKYVGLDAALLLSDLVTKYEYFKENNQVDDEWFFNTSQNIEDDTTLSYFKQKAAIKILIEKGFIETKLIGIPAKLHFKLLENKISSFLNTCIEKNQILYNKNTINKNKEKEYQHNKNADVYNSFKQIFLKKYYDISGTEYYFLAKDGAKIKSLIQKIKHAYKTSGNNSPSDEELTNGFIHILNRALNDNWIRNNFSLSIIDSQFNKLKLKENATREEIANTELRELLNSINSGK